MRLKPPLVLLLFITVVACAALSAQTGSAVPVWQANTNGEQVANSTPSVMQPYSTIFATGSSGSQYVRSIQVVPAEEMSRHDRDLAAGAESSIRERAGFQSLGFNEGDCTVNSTARPCRTICSSALRATKARRK
jgi:hypothetical protein